MPAERLPCPPPPPDRAPAAAPLADALARLLAGRAAAPSPVPGRRAAVLIVLYDRAGEAHLLLTKRTDTVPSHPGQVSLPGGVAEAGDAGLRDTALRETHEEVGIPPEALRVVGELDEVPTIASGFVIRPFVALLGAPLVPIPSDAEVARVLEVPVAALLRADAGLPERPTITTLRYPLLGEDVWGATARILRIFSRVARCALAGAR